MFFIISDLYYGGEAFSVEQPQSFTCPYCGKMGYTETSLQEHVTSEHAETSTEVVIMIARTPQLITEINIFCCEVPRCLCTV